MEVFCKPQEKIIKDHQNKIIERGIWKSLAVEKSYKG
ncbi:hypothetical protein ZEAMMB73_Zm00001d032580 [Zea mays]|uniref:Uncharacterized protein n=1 Tax=Zea mays TaxID=4577 RepID=A0A1D6KRV5_MAIZE|nr:hypothetical protein ZEAMMB73_Zm00001d032580 [Zea mays]